MNQGTPVLLTKIKTRDGITLDGIYVPPKRKGETALIWIHGLSSRFSSGQELIKELSLRCQKSGIGYFKFNTRGHDAVNHDGHGNKKLQGGGFEKFEECVLDIHAMAGLAKALGYHNIFLVGHSTGANKALYYLYRTKTPRIKGLMLIGPISDIVAMKKLIGEKRLNQELRIAKLLKKQGRGNIMPLSSNRLNTAERFTSLYRTGESEDVFPYHNQLAKWKELQSIRTPMAVIVGSSDKHLDRPAKKLIDIFREKAIKTKSFSGFVITGANHGFTKKEKGLARTIMNWIKEISK